MKCSTPFQLKLRLWFVANVRRPHKSEHPACRPPRNARNTVPWPIRIARRIVHPGGFRLRRMGISYRIYSFVCIDEATLTSNLRKRKRCSGEMVALDSSGPFIRVAAAGPSHSGRVGVVVSYLSTNPPGFTSFRGHDTSKARKICSWGQSACRAVARKPSENPQRTNFCGNCRRPLTNPFPKCGADNP